MSINNEIVVLTMKDSKKFLNAKEHKIEIINIKKNIIFLYFQIKILPIITLIKDSEKDDKLISKE